MNPIDRRMFLSAAMVTGLAGVATSAGAAEQAAAEKMNVQIVNDFCAAPPGSVKRPLSGLPTLQYQLLRLRSRKPTPAMLALEQAIVSTLTTAR